jgi:DNA-binding protein HU-beta
MSKTELVDFVAAKAGLTKADAGRALDAVIEGITSGLKKEKKVALVGFGTFAAKKRAARNGINPLTKKAIKIEAKKVAKFKAGAELAEAVK